MFKVSQDVTMIVLGEGTWFHGCVVAFVIREMKWDEMSENMYPRLLFFDHTHSKMVWVKHQIQQKDGYLSYSPPLLSSSFSSLGNNLIIWNMSLIKMFACTTEAKSRFFPIVFDNWDANTCLGQHVDQASC